MESFSWALLIGGLAFFFFGLNAAREGLQLLAGDRLRVLLLRLTNNRVSAFGFGALVTLVLQSSSATTAMLVSFAGAQLLTLSQSFAVILGADVGTTAVVFLLAARKITDYALIAVAIGFGLYLFSTRKRPRYIGQIVFGFGLVFYGISLMVTAMAPIRQSPLISQLFVFLANTPFWAMVGAAIFTALIHSSAATLGLAISLAFSGVLTLEGALPIVLGANIGTTITAWMAAVGGDINARRVAGAHFLTKAAGVIIALPLLDYAAVGLQHITSFFGGEMGLVTGSLSVQIALAHLLFNLGLATLFLPLLPFGVWLVSRLFPEHEGRPEPFGPRYLDKRALETPSLAFAQAHREVLRIGTLAQALLREGIKLFDRGADFHRVVKEVQSLDDKVDTLEQGVRFFLARLSQESLTETQANTQMALLSIASDLEEIGDTISKESSTLAHKRFKARRTFSEEGWKELQIFHDQVVDLFSVTMACLTTRDPVLAEDVRQRATALSKLDAKFRIAHLRRLHQGMKVSVETSSIHLDLLSAFSRIGAKLRHIADTAVAAV